MPSSQPPYTTISGCQGDVPRQQYRLRQQPHHHHHQSSTHVRFPSPTEFNSAHVRQQAAPLADTELEVRRPIAGRTTLTDNF